MNVWDMLLFVGLACVVAGVAFIYWPLAIILFGLTCVSIAVLHEKGVNDVLEKSDSEQPTDATGGNL